jgi:hypothetical protein
VLDSLQFRSGISFSLGKRRTQSAQTKAPTQETHNRDPELSITRLNPIRIDS